MAKRRAREGILRLLGMMFVRLKKVGLLALFFLQTSILTKSDS